MLEYGIEQSAVRFATGVAHNDNLERGRLDELKHAPVVVVLQIAD